MELTLLNDILIIFALSIVVLFLFHKIKVPAIIGFLLTGVLTGPFGFGLVKSVHEVEILAEIGILLLLFTIGIEFSLKEMLQLKRSVLLGGSAQVGITILIVTLLSITFARSYNEAIFIGFLVALSSTAILLKLYYEKGEIETRHGKTILSILIFQDIIVVPMLLVTPILAGQSGELGTAVLVLLIKAAGVIIFVFISTKFIVPSILHQVAKTRSRELFLLTILVICFGIVWGTGELGLSLALGAFLAGLIISESDYSHQALSHVIPFRDAFTSLFFVSIGMLLNFAFFIDNILLVLVASIVVIILKFATGSIAAFSLNYPARTSLLVGFGLAQVGEFSFILAKTGLNLGFLNDFLYQNFLAVSILTMSVTPFLIKLAPKIVKRISSKPASLADESIQKDKLDDHLIIIGYGINGRNLSMAGDAAGIPFIVIEMNPDTVKEEKEKGTNIIYGDAAYPEILEQAKIKNARIVVIAINDPPSIQKIVVTVKKENSNAHVIVRTRHTSEVDQLNRLGADEVIPEEFETSVEIFTRVLIKYLIPRNEIERFVSEIRGDSYKIFRSSSTGSHPFPGIKLHFPELEISNFVIGEKFKHSGDSLSQLNLRNKLGITVLAIKRGDKVISNPPGSTIIEKDDILFVLAEHEKLNDITYYFDS